MLARRVRCEPPVRAERDEPFGAGGERRLCRAQHPKDECVLEPGRPTSLGPQRLDHIHSRCTAARTVRSAITSK